MRIGIFTDTYPPYINGVSTSIQMLERALRKKGHQVFIVTVNPENMTYKYEKNIIRIPGIPTGIYDYRLTGIYPVRAIKTIKKWNLDVIHSHTEFGIGTFARIIAKQLNIPLVHTYHTMYEDYVHYITKGYFNDTSKKIVEYLTKFYCDKTANAFIVPTIKTYHLFRNEYDYDKDIYIVPTGIDCTRVYEENLDKDKLLDVKKKLNYKKNDFVVIFVGRMAEEKNIEFLLRSMLHVKNKNIKLLLVGDGPDKEKYEQLAQDLNVEKSVKFTGVVPWDEMPYYYHNANVAVTASKTETQGLTVIEAMASNLPAVCIEDEAFHTMVVDGMNGKFFETEEECAKLLDKLKEDKKQLNNLSNKSKMVAKKFSLEEFATSVLDVYNAAIDNFNNKKDIPSIIKRVVKKEKEKFSKKNKEVDEDVSSTKQ